MHYGLCENGDLAYFILLGEWISKFDYMITYLVEDDAKTENGKMKNGNKKRIGNDVTDSVRVQFHFSFSRFSSSLLTISANAL